QEGREGPRAAPRHLLWPETRRQERVLIGVCLRPASGPGGSERPPQLRLGVALALSLGGVALGLAREIVRARAEGRFKGRGVSQQPGRDHRDRDPYRDTMHALIGAGVVDGGAEML